jgi:hypothetical protein
VIATAIPAAQTALDSSIYQVRVQRATDAERRYMRAMAELGSGPYRSGNVARKAGKSTTALSQIRQRLLDKGLIYATEDYGHIDFTIPRFDEFMRRHMPNRAPKRKRGTTDTDESSYHCPAEIRARALAHVGSSAEPLSRSRARPDPARARGPWQQRDDLRVPAALTRRPRA